MKSIYILYKSTRIETGEYYIGIHGIDTDKFPDFNDGYLGSGNRIKASVKKYSKKAFVRSILAISESRDVVLALEAAMVTVEMIEDPLCLNLVPGGRGGVKGVPRSTETRQKMSAALKGVPSPLKGVPRSTETRQAISDALKGGTRSAETRQAISDAKKGVSNGPLSAETRQAISDALKGGTRSAETRQAISDAKKGVPKSPEHRQALSDAKKEWWRQRKLSNSSMNLS